MHCFVSTVQLLIERAKMEKFDWLMDVIGVKGVWRFASTTTGELSAMMAGIRMTRVWCVPRWATLQMVSSLLLTYYISEKGRFPLVVAHIDDKNFCNGLS